MIEVLLPALLGGLGIATLTGPLGSFVVWRRMAYFGDTLSHSALLGVTLGLLLQLNLNLMVGIVCLSIAVIIVLLQRQKVIPGDTLLGILAHSSLALGLVIISLFSENKINLMGFLFGDLLTLSYSDLSGLAVTVVLVLALLVRYWRHLLLITLDEAIAQVEGVPVMRVKFMLMAMLAVTIAFAMKIVGILLITSLLIIPAAAARSFARSPEQMAMIAIGLGYLGVSSGIIASGWMDTPAGPTIVLCCFIIFLISLVLPSADRAPQS